MEGYWDVVVSSLQDTCNANEANSFDPLELAPAEGKDAKLQNRDIVVKHKENLEKTKRILDTALINVNGLLSQAKVGGHEADDGSVGRRNKLKSQKFGRSYYQSPYNPSEPVVVGSEVAFKPKQKGAEWIQCEVLKVLNEIKFEVKDPEPDENNPNGQIFKCTWKEIILMPTTEDLASLKNYPVGYRVLARYPETTTFYPAEVIGFKKDGTCRLKFEGEEEVGKETEVERKLVLPFPG
ncbi:hypothetical protein KL921_000040 [Ogataea angusta]|uniref:SGF29 C-terminal domain-containing protein n=1 Tax=Pichia angusta TaxID=870730 RepID=A0AAN6I854_PICAN|nr:uncharacterized protein KL928_000752 [Ogataea angusta]KAG7813766.1 hypothetical protein KL921_000040 [Ogataea angusta]KAG7822277.1 hypothetical protein KL928_000752 [Ogataea angusta]KAG7831625.1 hypothetical protein KL920_001145 [Ogataea angusta]KAG7842402.1 hypothetical protein KL942_001140 [Ogataea angusta]KAG7851803.1 hypothetical protein KL940_000685 [Ogataea angusta]